MDEKIKALTYGLLVGSKFNLNEIKASFLLFILNGYKICKVPFCLKGNICAIDRFFVCYLLMQLKISLQGKGTTIIFQPRDDDCESTSSKSSGKSSRGKRQVHTTGTETESEHPLRTLVKAARYMNPMQFDVGKEISCNVPLPGEPIVILHL